MPEFLSAFGFLFYRIGAATLFFWIISALLREKTLAPKKDMMRLMICGIFGASINMMLFFKGLTLTRPINASILMMGAPIMVLVLSAVLLGEKITNRKALGVFLGLFGSVIILVFKSDFSFAKETFLGDFMIFLNAASYGLYLVLVKPLIKKYSGFFVAKWVFLFGWISSSFFTFSEALQVNFSVIPPVIYAYIFYIIFFSSILSYFLNLFAVKHVGPSVVSMYIYAQPLVASIFSISIGMDVFSIEKIIGAAPIFIGVYLVSIEKTSVQIKN